MFKGQLYLKKKKKKKGHAKSVNEYSVFCRILNLIFYIILNYIIINFVPHLIQKFKSSYEALLNYDMLTVEHNDLVLFRLHWKNVEVSLVLNDRKEKYEKGKMTKNMHSESSSEEKSEEHMDVRQKHCLAYVLHTSGTTGIPKIVRVPHACIVPNIQHFR